MEAPKNFLIGGHTETARPEGWLIVGSLLAHRLSNFHEGLKSISSQTEYFLQCSQFSKTAAQTMGFVCTVTLLSPCN